MTRDTFSTQQIEEFCAFLDIDKEKDIFIFDPYMLHAKDVNALGIKNLVRITRPGWGMGNIKDYFLKISFKEFKNLLTKEKEDGS